MSIHCKDEVKSMDNMKLKHIGERENCKKKHHSTFIVLAQIISFLEILKFSKKIWRKKRKTL
jgi:hypothetical protein